MSRSEEESFETNEEHVLDSLSFKDIAKGFRKCKVCKTSQTNNESGVCQSCVSVKSIRRNPTVMKCSKCMVFGDCPEATQGGVCKFEVSIDKTDLGDKGKVEDEFQRILKTERKMMDKLEMIAACKDLTDEGEIIKFLSYMREAKDWMSAYQKHLLDWTKFKGLNNTEEVEKLKERASILDKLFKGKEKTVAYKNSQVDGNRELDELPDKVVRVAVPLTSHGVSEFVVPRGDDSKVVVNIQDTPDNVEKDVLDEVEEEFKRGDGSITDDNLELEKLIDNGKLAEEDKSLYRGLDMTVGLVINDKDAKEFNFGVLSVEEEESAVEVKDRKKVGDSDDPGTAERSD